MPSAAALAVLTALAAHAAPLGITPTQVDLDPHQRSDLVAITNDGDDPVRLQVDVFGWDQRPDGETVLAPTQDIVAFPPLLEVGAHETKRIRVGAEAPPDAVEKSYRMTIQELPPQPKEGVTGVQMLTNISMPIFLGPGRVQPNPTIAVGTVAKGVLSFSVRNLGTQHFLLRNVLVTGLDVKDAKIFDAKASGWYVLAGGTRDYQLAMAPGDCRSSRVIQLEAQLQDQAIDQRLTLAADACGGDSAKTHFVIAPGAPQ